MTRTPDRRAGRRSPVTPPGALPVLAALAALAAPAALAPGCAPAPRQGPGAPDVVLISLDTLRRDHVGAYRTEGSSFTPALDRLAASSVVLEEAFVTVPFTLPSHLSMLTGLHPETHGVWGERARLSERAPTLAEILGARGYRTIGLVSIDWLDAKFGFGRGFDHYERIRHDLTYSDRLNRRLFELLDRRRDGRPLFLFLHYFDPHSDFFEIGHNRLPYYARPDYLERIGIDPGTREFCTPGGECATGFLIAANRDRSPLAPAAMARIEALYRGGVEYLDHDLGALFEGLERRGLFDRALIVVTADHGEELRDHGEFIHSQPYVENMAVPLLIRLPGGERGGTRRRGLAESPDLLPTVLDLAGVEVPSHVQGRSLVPLIESGRPVRSWSLGRDKAIPTRYSLRTPESTLIHDFETGESLLFDREADPRETADLGAVHPERMAELLATLDRALRRSRRLAPQFPPDPLPESGALTDEQVRRLRALGYLD
jgi:arylsulfatase A-like enzyme